MTSFEIRPAEKSDCKQIRDMIVELAVYEKMPDSVKITVEDLEKDGFSDDKYYHCMVAESGSQTDNPDSRTLVGYVLYFYMYSTWEGKFIHMEDLYVKPEYRGKGIGLSLWKAATKIAVEKNCQRFQWSVLDWNKPSIEFYKSQGGFDLTEKEGWHAFRMCRPEMEKFIAK